MEWRKVTENPAKPVATDNTGRKKKWQRAQDEIKPGVTHTIHIDSALTPPEPVATACEQPSVHWFPTPIQGVANGWGPPPWYPGNWAYTQWGEPWRISQDYGFARRPLEMHDFSQVQTPTPALALAQVQAAAQEQAAALASLKLEQAKSAQSAQSGQSSGSKSVWAGGSRNSCGSTALPENTHTAILGSAESDNDIENIYIQKITDGCQRDDWTSSWRCFLEFREIWLIFQQRFRNRRISFSKFNKKYQTAFKILRDTAERLCEKPYPILASIERKWITTRKDAPAEELIRVLTFNILSDALSEQFSFQFVVLDDPDLGEKSGDFLSWNRREPQILAEIRRWNPDIVLLQEVDLNCFGSLVKMAGLTPAGPCIKRHASAPDGICILYKESGKLKLEVPPRGFDLIGGGQAMMCTFTDRHGNPIEVVNSHVQGMSPALDFSRASQLHGAASASRRIIAGDFNGMMPEAEKVLASLSSAYDHPEAMATHADVITCHNDEYHSCGELDFIMTSGRVCGFAEIQNEERLTSVRLKTHPKRSLPNPFWPSDHVSLVCDIDFSHVSVNHVSSEGYQ